MDFAVSRRAASRSINKETSDLTFQSLSLPVR
jgi:hypothetical protein